MNYHTKLGLLGILLMPSCLESLTCMLFPRYTTVKPVVSRVPIQPKMHSDISSHQERWRETAR